MSRPRGPHIIYSADLKRRAESRKPPPSPWLGALQLAVTVGIIASLIYGFLFFWQATAPKEVVVPKVEGLEEAAAEILLHHAGLEAEIAARRASDTVGEGKVIEARPDPGRRVKQGRRIGLIISAGSAWTNVPDIREMSERRAEAVLKEKSLFLGQRRYIYHASLPKGFVVEQLPAPGTRLPKNSEVQAVISKGPRPAAPPRPRAEQPRPAPPPPAEEPLEPEAETGY